MSSPLSPNWVMDYKLTIKLYVLAFFLLQKTKNKIVQDEKMSAVDGVVSIS